MGDAPCALRRTSPQTTAFYLVQEALDDLRQHRLDGGAMWMVFGTIATGCGPQ